MGIELATPPTCTCPRPLRRKPLACTSNQRLYTTAGCRAAGQLSSLAVSLAMPPAHRGKIVRPDDWSKDDFSSFADTSNTALDKVDSYLNMQAMRIDDTKKVADWSLRMCDHMNTRANDVGHTKIDDIWDDLIRDNSQTLRHEDPTFAPNAPVPNLYGRDVANRGVSTAAKYATSSGPTKYNRTSYAGPQISARSFDRDLRTAGRPPEKPVEPPKPKLNHILGPMCGTDITTRPNENVSPAGLGKNAPYTSWNSTWRSRQKPNTIPSPSSPPSFFANKPHFASPRTASRNKPQIRKVPLSHQAYLLEITFACPFTQFNEPEFYRLLTEFTTLWLNGVKMKTTAVVRERFETHWCKPNGGTSMHIAGDQRETTLINLDILPYDYIMQPGDRPGHPTGEYDVSEDDVRPRTPEEAAAMLEKGITNGTIQFPYRLLEFVAKPEERPRPKTAAEIAAASSGKKRR